MYFGPSGVRPVGAGRQRLLEHPLGHRLRVGDAAQLPLALLQRRAVGPLDHALVHPVFRHQDAAEALRVDPFLVQLPVACIAVEAEIHGIGDAAAAVGHSGCHVPQVCGGVADVVLDRLAVERGGDGILQSR
jgi:hypothetical protein